MDNDAASDDRGFGPGNGDVLHRDFVVRFAVIVGVEISQIAGMTGVARGQTVGVVSGVVMAAGAHAVRGRTITKLVDMKGVLLTRIQPLNIGHDLDAIAFLHEVDGAVTLVAGGEVK